MYKSYIKIIAGALLFFSIFYSSDYSLAVESSDSFDSDPYGGRWVNEIKSATWDSTNGELDISNDNDIAIRYVQSSSGSIEHEAQVTALMVTGERLVGPGVRFDNSGTDSMYGMVVEGPAVNIYRYNLGVRTHIASIASGVSSVAGNYYTMRMSASGTSGNSVVLNVWVQDHGSTKPSDPGWIGNDGSPNVTYTDTSASGTRLDGNGYTQAGIAGRASTLANDNRHDYFKTRAISDRGGSVVIPTPTPTSVPVSTPTPTPTPVSASPAPAPISGGQIIFDDFEYVVSRNNPTECSNFMANGWITIKANNCALNPEPNRYYGNGNIFTTNSIPNYSGQFPSGGSRVLAMEALPVTYQGQTDFYLQYGSGEGAIGQIPPNHWVQFWIYSENTTEHPSLFTPQSKFLYYNRATYYPATLGNEGGLMLVGLTNQSSAPLFADPCPAFPSEEFICDRGFFYARWESDPNATDGLRHGNVSNHIDYVEDSLGANLTQEAHVVPNGWTLVRMHFDITGTDPRALPGQAVQEMWIRRPGDTAWTKTMEYFGGVTQVNGQTLDFYPRYSDGFRMVRIPTTVGSSTYPTDTRDNTRNYWIYMDDYAMTTSESSLPSYNFQGTPVPVATPVPGDTTPPVISNISVSGLTQTNATITWTTNENSDSQIVFPTGQCPGTTNCSSPLVSTLTTNHSINLGNSLLANTTYTYQIRSRDAAGNLVTSSNQTFRTSAQTAATPSPTPTPITISTPLPSNTVSPNPPTTPPGGGSGVTPVPVTSVPPIAGTTPSQTVQPTPIKTPHPRIVVFGASPKVYALADNKLKWITNIEVFRALNLDWQRLEKRPLSEEKNYKRANLLRARGDTKVYYITEKGLKRWIPTAEVFLSYGNKFSDVVEVEPSEILLIAESNLVRVIGDSKVYLIENNQKRWIKTAEAFNRNGYNWTLIAPINQIELNSWSEGVAVE